ncbi:hypothetical protein TSMEX_006722, partial [Taenia solium]
ICTDSIFDLTSQRKILKSTRTSTHIKLVVTQPGFASNASAAEENARRIGLYFGHLLIVYIWSCLERHIYLASFKHSRQLAKILICRLGALLECTSLLSLARDSLVQTLLQRRSEFRLLLRFFYEPRRSRDVVLATVESSSDAKGHISSFPLLGG